MTSDARLEPRWASMADAGALFLLALSAWTLTGGGFRFTLGPLPVSATSPVHLLMEAATVLLVRHGLVRVLAPAPGDRRRFVLAYALLLVTLAALSIQRRVGDGHEYLAMALNLSRLHPPAISDAERFDIEQTFTSLDRGFQGISLANPGLRGRDGRQDFTHFWLYPLLAAPWIWFARAVALPISACFTFVNIALLVLALWIVSGCVRRDVALLLFAGPILWWTDKGHTEAFIFALLAIAVALLPDAPWWSCVALGVAAAQNPAIIPTLPLLVVAAIATRPAIWRDRRLWFGAIAGGAIAAIHPLYYWHRLGRSSPLAGVASYDLPSFAQWSAPLVDLNVGILINFPWLTLAVVTALVALAWRSADRLRAPSIWFSLAVLAVFLAGFSQIPNVNHGGTPGISRYGLWLVPLTLPVFAQCDGLGRRPRMAWLGVLALVSCLWCIQFFHPAIATDYHVPTPLADAVWTHYPAMDNPLPEVFGERVIGLGDQSWLPLGTPHCEKVLLLGDGHEPRWPVPCAPAPLPDACAIAGSLCYANASGGGYRFAAAPNQSGFDRHFGPTWTWTGSSVSALRRMLHEVSWNELRIVPLTDPAPMVRRFERIDWVYVLQSDGQFLAYVSHPAMNAALTIETAAPMSGRIVDLETGDTLRDVEGATRFLKVEVPGPRREALLILTRTDGKSTIVK